MKLHALCLVLILFSFLPEAADAAPDSSAKVNAVSGLDQIENSEHDNRECGYFDCISLEPLIDDVTYTVRERISVTTQAAKWGIPLNVILMLNNELKPETMLVPGQKLLVEARIASEAVPYSSGKCNRGRLYHGRLMPEIQGAFMRSYRPNSWGTDTTIQALMTLFKAYHDAFPEAAPINLGDISRRRGGRLKPHKSHQSGRDVDIGFAHLPSQDDEKQSERFKRASAENLDLEKTWFIVQTLARTGTVKVIYLDKTIMKLLYNYVSSRLTQQQIKFFFSNPRHLNSSDALLQHWPGHRNHFHIRFNCPPEQAGCRN